MLLDSNLVVMFADNMCKENLNAKMEKLKAQICRCTRQGLKVMSCAGAEGNPQTWLNFKALSCTPTSLNAPISPFLSINSYEIWC